jgi:hypothetical protein
MRTCKSLLALLPILFVNVLSGCGASADGDSKTTDDSTGTEATDKSYDSALLEQYRAALPSEDALAAPAPGEATSPNALTLKGNAELANLAAGSARDINAVPKLMVVLLRTITKLPPTVYNSDKKEFVWGPWDNEDDYGQVLVYIHENPKGDDFKYGYALVRLVDSDLATAKPVIWGGGTPGANNDDLRGVGVTLWDFVANNEFDKANDPNYDAATARDQGRFAMVFGRGDKADGKFAFNVAVFRNFVPKDKPESDPANLDYFFGHFKGTDGNVVDFVDWSLDANLCDADAATCFKDPADGAAENLGLRAAFFNRGVGRAEAKVSGGDLNTSVNVTECWDASIDRTGITVSDDAGMIVNDGQCEGAFASDLDTLGVPSLADVDPDMLAKMDCAASNGLEACKEK